ncbi:MAG: aspartate aminotransferase family protein [Cellulosilyticaceae bacterium]
MQTWIEEGENYILKTYNRFPIVIDHGEGCEVYDTVGKKYLDMTAGIAVNSLGYHHPKLTKALKKQVDELLHISNLYYTKPQVKAAKLLVEHSLFDKVFFCNSGAEANEAAIKLARKYGKQKDTHKTKIVTLKDSFHGRTCGALTATAQPKYQENFMPLMPNFVYAALNDVESIKTIMDDQVCAVLLEVIQGEGGIKVADQSFLQEVQALCKKHDALLMIDEVQTGIGRTGTLFGFEQFNITPDVVTLAKGLGGGVPIGAMMCREDVAVLVPGDHASTFGGNPLVTAAAKVVLEELLEENLMGHIQQVAEHLEGLLSKLVSKYDVVAQRRGVGLIQGIELRVPAAAIINACLEKGVLFVAAGSHVIRFVPPLIVSEEEVGCAVQVLEEVLKSLA